MKNINRLVIIALTLWLTATGSMAQTPVANQPQRRGDGKWTMGMNDGNQILRISWKQSCGLAWQNVPTEGVTSYFGFMNVINMPTLNNPQNVTVRYGSTNSAVATVNATTGAIISEQTVGTTYIYAVHDADDNYMYDSVAYPLVVNRSYILKIASNDMTIGTVALESPLPAGVATTSIPWMYIVIPGTEVAVIATPATDYHLESWSNGAAVNADDSIHISVDSNINLTATFEYNAFNVSVSAIGNGTVSISYTDINGQSQTTTPGATAQAYVMGGTAATITATPSEHYHVEGWSDEPTNTSASRSVSVATNLSVTFDADRYQVSAIAAIDNRYQIGSGLPMGTVKLEGSHQHYHTDTLTVVNAHGYTFAGWYSGVQLVYIADSFLFSPVHDIDYTAQFTVNDYTVSAVSDNAQMGSVTGSATVPYLTMVPITATPNSGYHFMGWSNGLTAQNVDIKAYDDSTLTAYFDTNVYNLAVNIAAGQDIMGSVDGSNATAKHFLNYQISAIPVTGYHFVQWNNGSTTNPRTVTLTSDSTFTASFDTNHYNLAVNIAAGQSAMGNVSGSQTAKHFLTYQIEAMPITGCHFTGWTDGIMDNPRTVSLTSDSSFTATFDTNTYNLAVAIAAGQNIMGSVEGSNATAKHFLNYQISATPVTGYHFVQWNDGNTINPRTVTLTSDSSFTATFDTNCYNLAVNIAAGQSAMGSVNGSQTAKHFLTYQIEASPITGCHFTGWTDGVMDNPRMVSLTSDSSFTATFDTNSYELTVTIADGQNAMGSVSGSQTVKHFLNYQIEASPITGCHFTGWTDGIMDNPRTVTLTSDSTFTATFDTNSYIITAIAAIDNRTDIGTGLPMGSIDLKGRHMHFLFDTLSATAFHGYTFSGWFDGLNMVDNDNPYRFSPQENKEYTAQFSVNNYTVTAVSDATVMGSATGTATVPYLTMVPLTATPNTGYHFTTWSNGLTTQDITIQAYDDSTLTAYFDTNTYNLTVAIAAGQDIMGSVEGSNADAKHFLTYQISATPNTGYHFTQWADGNTDNPRTVSLTSDSTFTAMFDTNSYELTVNIAAGHSAMGSVSGSQTVKHFLNYQIEATPIIGCHFTGWTDGVMDNPRTVSLTSDSTFTATFDTNTYNLNVVVADGQSQMGTVTGSNSAAKHFLSYQIEAINDICHHFVQWADGNTDNPRTVSLTSDSTFTATFERNAPLLGDTAAVAYAPFTWYEHTDMTATQNVSHDLLNANGCDSTVTLHLRYALFNTVWSGETTVTYNALPQTALDASYVDDINISRNVVLTFTKGNEVITTPDYPVTAGVWTVEARPVLPIDSLTGASTTLTILPATVYVSGATVETAKFADDNTEAMVTNSGILNNVQGTDAVTHTTVAAFNDATVGDNKTITLSYALVGEATMLENYTLNPSTEVYSTNAYIIEPMTPDTNRTGDDTTMVKDGIDIYAYGYCTGGSYGIRYHLVSGNPDQYKIDFADARFTDVSWTDLVTPGAEGTIEVDVPADLPTGDYQLTVTFRDSRFTWLESNPITVTFHVNLPETYTMPLFGNVIALVDTCHCFSDIQWYHRADASSDWVAIPGANGYYYHATDGELSGEFFIKAKMNGMETFTCPQTDMSTLIKDSEDQLEVSAWPNPTRERVNVSVRGSMQDVHTLRVISTVGVEIESRTFEGDSTVIDMSGYQQGNYMVSVDGVVVRVIRN